MSLFEVKGTISILQEISMAYCLAYTCSLAVFDMIFCVRLIYIYFSGQIGLPGVLWVLPDSYLDVPNKDYGGMHLKCFITKIIYIPFKLSVFTSHFFHLVLTRGFVRRWEGHPQAYILV